MTREDQPDTHGKWYPEIENLIGHTSKVCEMHGANTVPQEFDLARVKAACSRAEELLSLTPIEAAPIIAKMQNQIELPLNVGDDDHMLRSELYHVMAAKLSLNKLEKSLPEEKVAHGQQIIDPVKNGEDLRAMYSDAAALLKIIEARTGTPIYSITDEGMSPSDWEARKRELLKTAVDGGTVSIAGPGISVRAISAIAELLYMHLRPMVEINVQLLSWYASLLKTRAAELIARTIESVDQSARTFADTVSKTALGIVQKIIRLIRKPDGESKGAGDTDTSDEIEQNREYALLLTSENAEEMFCVNITHDQFVLSSTKRGLLVLERLRLLELEGEIFAVGKDATDEVQYQNPPAKYRYPIGEHYISDPRQARELIKRFTEFPLHTLLRDSKNYYAAPLRKLGAKKTNHLELLNPLFGSPLEPVSKSDALGLGLSHLHPDSPVMIATLDEAETTISLFNKGRPANTRVFDLNARTLDYNFHQHYRSSNGDSVSKEEAIELRRRIVESQTSNLRQPQKTYPLRGKNRDQITLDNYCRTNLTIGLKWIELIDKEIEVYREVEPEAEHIQIYVAGHYGWLATYAARQLTNRDREVLHMRSVAFPIQQGLHVKALNSKSV
ncbi:MAG: hypothetical protein AAGF33_00425 [Pseudomonadota bacterium]